jgi:hypothetical protein
MTSPTKSQSDETETRNASLAGTHPILAVTLNQQGAQHVVGRGVLFIEMQCSFIISQRLVVFPMMMEPYTLQARRLCVHEH